jgi:hypothetical protein
MNPSPEDITDIRFMGRKFWTRLAISRPQNRHTWILWIPGVGDVEYI